MTIKINGDKFSDSIYFLLELSIFLYPVNIYPKVKGKIRHSHERRVREVRFLTSLAGLSFYFHTKTFSSFWKVVAN